MKKTFLFLLTALVAVSCSDDPDKGEPELPGKPPVGEQSQEPANIEYGVAKKRGNIYELMVFYLNVDKDTARLSLFDSYDSIVWTSADLNGRYKIMDHGVGWGNLTSSWSNNFFLPGDYKTYLSCYKNDTVRRCDSVTVNIVNQKDFLAFDWSEITDTVQLATDFLDLFPNEIEWRMKYSVETDVHYMTLFPWPVHWKDFDMGVTDVFKEKEGQSLYDYMCALYALPQYTESDKAALGEVYKKLFANQPENWAPKAIWLTGASEIVLLYCPDGENFTYKVVAEPRA